MPKYTPNYTVLQVTLKKSARMPDGKRKKLFEFDLKKCEIERKEGILFVTDTGKKEMFEFPYQNICTVRHREI